MGLLASLRQQRGSRSRRRLSELDLRRFGGPTVTAHQSRRERRSADRDGWSATIRNKVLPMTLDWNSTQSPVSVVPPLTVSHRISGGKGLLSSFAMISNPCSEKHHAVKSSNLALIGV